METEGTPTIYIGKKPLMRYVMAAMSMIINEKQNEIKLSARGRAISRAVDVAEILRTRYLPGLVSVKDIKIGTDEIAREDSDRVDRVSTIEITLVKTGEIQGTGGAE
ncbi:MAG: DNA-binding protein Alba [Candidatus Njordarchaeia archaeon]